MMRGSRALRIWPNCELVISLTGFSGLKLLVTLNTSHRNSTRCASLNLKLRDKPMSKSHWCGPATVRVPTLPNVPTAGVVKAFLFKYTPTVVEPLAVGNGRAEWSRIGSPPTYCAGCVLMFVPLRAKSLLVPAVMLMYVPLRSRYRGESRQPEATSRNVLFENCGISRTDVRLSA